MGLRIVFFGAFALFLRVEAAAAAIPEPSLTAAGLRMFWGLLIVLGILLLLYGLARKKLSFLHSNPNSRIKIIEIRHIMPKKSLCLVEISGKEYLLGVGTESVTLLAEPTQGVHQSFDSTLQKATQKHE